MPRDTSLDEFLSSGDDEDGDEDRPGEATALDVDPEEDPVEDPEPGEATAEDAGGDSAEGPDPGDGPVADPGSREGSAADPGLSADDADEPPVDPAAASPARSTFDWRPDGAECAACGSTVTRRWRATPADDDAFDDGDSPMVCRDCKEW